MPAAGLPRSGAPPSPSSAPTLDGQAALVVDLESGRILYEKSMSEQRAPASLTKIMTVLLVLEAVEAGASAGRRGHRAERLPAGHVGGQQHGRHRPGRGCVAAGAAVCAMVGSANEACNVIGSYLSGSVSAFVERMNERAAQLGCTNTHFVNTNGLPAEDHYSTAYDLYLITTEAMKHPLFMEMCNTQSYEPSTGAINEGKTMHNSNALITTQSDYGAGYEYSYASGVKTGFTQAAGYCLISTAERGGVRALVIIMGCNGWYNAQIEPIPQFHRQHHPL